MRTTLIALLGFVTAAALAFNPAEAQSVRKEPDAKIAAAIRAVIEAQRDAWNRGDIDGYMDGYARSEETVFISGDNVTHGWQTVLDRYKKGYDHARKDGHAYFLGS